MTKKFFKDDSSETDNPTSPTRRALLLGAGATGVASVLASQAANARASNNALSSESVMPLKATSCRRASHFMACISPAL
jgi:deferrochelatase/peroxidase EfeB